MNQSVPNPNDIRQGETRVEKKERYTEDELDYWKKGELILHDDVIKWKHFPCYWPFVRGIHRSPVNSPPKGQGRRALMFYWSVPVYKPLS